MKSSIFFSALCLLSFATTPLCANAESGEVRIKDTSGITRGVSEIDGDENSVEFSVVDQKGKPADEVEVTLTNEKGETKTEKSKGGVVLFSGVTAGTWTVASATGITFTNVSIVAGSAAVAAAAGGGAAVAASAGAAGAGVGGLSIGGAAIAATGTVAAAGAAVAVSEATSGDNNDELSPST